MEQIHYKKNKDGFLWAWKESADVNIWRHAASIKEIKEQAKKMFNNKRLRLILV